MTITLMPAACAARIPPKRESSEGDDVHIVVHLLGHPSQVEMRLSRSTVISEMLNHLYIKIGFGPSLKRVLFCRRALPVESSAMRLPMAADLQRPLHEYGFGQSREPDHIHVVLELGHDPQRPPDVFRYVAADWFRP